MILPPLRQRRSDIPLLTTFFVERFARQLGKQITGVAQDTMETLSRYDWPGNIRELQNVIERAVVLSRGSVLRLGRDLLPVTAEPLPGEECVASAASNSQQAGSGSGECLSLEQMEKRYILQVLKQTDWVIEGQSGAAKVLDLHPNTLRSRMKRLGLDRSAMKSAPSHEIS
jgi:formate hydrogenlyase transcriptional activator